MLPLSLLKSTMRSFVLLVTVRAPGGQVLYLLPVGCLIIVADEADHRVVVHKWDDGVGSMYRSAVLGEEGVAGWAQHTALWYTCVECGDGSAGVS